VLPVRVSTVLWLGAIAFVGAGTLMVFSGWHRDAAPGVLLLGIVYAVARVAEARPATVGAWTRRSWR
jgi:hypothetical protein